MKFSFLYGALVRRGKALALSILAVPLTAWSALAEPVVVAALGDSLTHGYGVAQEAGFVPQLESWLRGHGLDVMVQNAGVSGDTTQGGLARVGWTLGPDVDAMIVTLGGNDALRGVDPAVSKANLAGIIEAGQAADVDVLLVGVEAPMNFGADYKQAFDGMYGALATQYDVSLAPDFFAAIRYLPADELRGLMQADGIHPNAEGVARIVPELGPYVVQLLEMQSR
ncbi:arylesterase [Shimia marina]|uniref:Esterase TesA n=1 Tax=Shimia marina TaxID=321267 RepID=A0A0P1EPW5_9RHOB|nr:arylesterase [Shimia marina]CUH51922.1 Esterase TesA precursor [Shimia marina]SFE45620.1 acyl-CoA thioesterase-1 [Shimia marina]